MDCLWKRQRLSSNHSLLCDCAAGLERKRSWCWMGVGEGELGGGVNCIPHSRGPFAWSYRLASLPLQGKHWINDALYHIVAKTNVLLLKSRQESWCDLCMYTNELCWRMLSRWLPSFLDIDPSRVKTGRKQEANKQQQQQSCMAH